MGSAGNKRNSFPARLWTSLVGQGLGNTLAASVANEYGIVLVSYSSTATIASDNESIVERLPNSRLYALQGDVQEFRNLSSDVLGILSDGDVNYAGSRSDLEKAQRNADNVLRAISAELQKAG